MNGFLRRAKSGYNCSVKTHPPPRSKSQPSRHTQEQVEYVQLLVFQMNSHRIDLQLAGRAISIYIESSPTSSLFLTCFQIVRDFFVNSIGVK